MSFRVLYPFQPAWILVAANSTARGSNLLGSERTDGGFLDVIFCEIWLWFHAVTWKKFMSRNVCVVIESPTFRLGELLCLLEELRRRHLLVRGRRAASASAATAEQVHAELVHVGQVWTALLNENNDIFDVSGSLSLSRHQMFHRPRDDAKSAYHSWGTCTRSLALARSHPRSLFPRTAGQLVIDGGG